MSTSFHAVCHDCRCTLYLDKLSQDLVSALFDGRPAEFDDQYDLAAFRLDLTGARLTEVEDFYGQHVGHRIHVDVLDGDRAVGYREGEPVPSPDVWRALASSSDKDERLEACRAAPYLENTNDFIDRLAELATTDRLIVVREAAIGALSDLVLNGVHDGDVRRAIHDAALVALDDKSKKVRLGAVRALGVAGHVDALPPLLERLEDPELAAAAGVALQMLTRRGGDLPPSAVGLLEAAVAKRPTPSLLELLARSSASGRRQVLAMFVAADPAARAGLWTTFQSAHRPSEHPAAPPMVVAPHPSIRPLDGHTAGIEDLAFSDDGALLASAARDAVRLWDADDGRCLRVFEPGRTVAFAPKREALAFGDTSSVTVFEPPSNGTPTRIPLGGSKVVFAPDGRLVLVGRDRLMMVDPSVWRTGAPWLGIDRNWCSIAAFDGPDRLLIHIDDELRTVDTTTGQVHGRYGAAPRFRQASFDPDCTRFAIWDGELVIVYDIASGQRLFERPEKSSGFAMAFSRTKLCVSGALDVVEVDKTTGVEMSRTKQRSARGVPVYEGDTLWLLGQMGRIERIDAGQTVESKDVPRGVPMWAHAEGGRLTVVTTSGAKVFGPGGFEVAFGANEGVVGAAYAGDGSVLGIVRRDGVTGLDAKSGAEVFRVDDKTTFSSRPAVGPHADGFRVVATQIAGTIDRIATDGRVSRSVEVVSPGALDVVRTARGLVRLGTNNEVTWPGGRARVEGMNHLAAGDRWAAVAGVDAAVVDLDDGTVRPIDIESGATALAVTSDRHLLVGRRDFTIDIVDIEKAVCRSTFFRRTPNPAFIGGVTALIGHPTRTEAAIGVAEVAGERVGRTVERWRYLEAIEPDAAASPAPAALAPPNVGTPTELARFDAPVTALWAEADGVLVGDAEGRLHRLDASGAVAATVQTNERWIAAIAVSPDYACTGGWDGRAVLVDRSLKIVERIESGLFGRVEGCVFDPLRPDILYAFDHSGFGFAWDVRQRAAIWRAPNHTSPAGPLTIHPDGRRLFGFGHGGAIVVDRRYGNRAVRFSVPGACTARLDPNGDIAAFGTHFGRVELMLHDGDSFEPLVSIDKHREPISDIVFRPDGRALATASWDGAVRLWSTDGDALGEMTAHDGPVFALAALGDAILSGGADGRVVRWPI